MLKTLRFCIVFLLAMFFISISSIAEEITLTTYYPVTYGQYVELRASKLAVGSSTSMPTEDGELTASGKIRTNNVFNCSDNDGVTQTYTVVTDLRIESSILQKKIRSITVTGGITTAIGSETWVDVGNINP